jgi:carbonic anhydrase
VVSVFIIRIGRCVLARRAPGAAYVVTMKALPEIFRSNAEWSDRMRASKPDFFESLSKAQTPQFLWVGCSDSRVPANEITGLSAGDMFVHRNVANVVVHTDFNLLSVLQYAVEVLKVRHVIVCGHYGCGGVRAAMSNGRFGLIDNWLRNIKDVYARFATELDAIEDVDARADRFCELNVTEQVANLCYTTIVQDAWSRGQELYVHGWIYGLGDGKLKDLDLCISATSQLPAIYQVVR